MSAEGARERPRLNLKPRNEAAAAQAAQERAKASKSSPFGEAKPREAILATRTGQKEEDILKAELEKEKLKLHFTPEQNGKRQAVQAAISELEEGLKAETDEGKKVELEKRIGEKKSDLEQLLAEFERLAVERAKNGEGIRPSERRRLAEDRERDQGSFPSGAGNYTVPPRSSYNETGFGVPAGDGYSAKSGQSNTYGYRRRGGSNGSGYEANSSGFRGYDAPSSGGGYRLPPELLGEASQGGYGSGFGGRGGGYTEPLAHGYESGPRPGRGNGERRPGSFDMFAAGSAPNAQVDGSSYGQGQDRF